MGRSSRSSAVRILQRIGYGERESIGHDAKFGRKTPGWFPIHLDQDRRGINGGALKGSGLAELDVSGAPQLASPDQGQVGDVTPGAPRGHEREFELRPKQIGFGGDLE